MTPSRSDHLPRGAALLISLVILSAIALITIGFFSVAQTEAQISGIHTDSVHAAFAERAAFEDAKNLLTFHTTTEDYLVTTSEISSGEASPGSGETKPWRYTFITKPSRSSIEHIPLFAGGVPNDIAIPDFSSPDSNSLSTEAIARPEVSFNSDSTVRKIESFGLSHQGISGERILENRFPETGLVEPTDGNAGKRRMRYTYWIEDLEGYPNVDVAGIWSDYETDSDGATVYDLIRPGYSSTDARTLPDNGKIFGARLEFPGNQNLAFQFPKSFRGQELSGQIAPGLSPREVLLFPWATSGGISIENHPFANARAIAASRHRLAGSGAHPNSSSKDDENRFSVGLKPYKIRPTIPFGHRYPEEGKLRYNLNKLIAERAVSRDSSTPGIVEVIDSNLPDFQNIRKGGFPDEESYIGALAGSIIDYADTDNFPATPANTLAGSESFRGVDSYCVVNEFYTKMEYDGYIISGDNFVVRFLLTPFVEFWNTSNQVAEMNNLTLNFRFIEEFGFQGPQFDWYQLDGQDNEYITEDSARNDPISITLEPNEYRVAEFGHIEWKIEIPRSGLASFSLDSVTERGSKTKDVRGYYELFMGDAMIDRSSRKYPGDREDPPDHGFHFVAFRDGTYTRDMNGTNDGQILSDDHIMRCAAPGLAMIKGSNWGSKFGDPWMNYYTGGTADKLYYYRDATPGGRNYRHYQMGRNPDAFKNQSRIREWPDRAFGTEPAAAPGSATTMPDSHAESPAYPEFAPWRISNEGRYFSITELGHIHDPHMWRTQPTADGTSFGRSSVSRQSYSRTGMKENIRNMPAVAKPDFQATPDRLWGGGNTLRIGRKEHDRFDLPGARASQLLDLFHVGTNGTNLRFGKWTGSDFEVDESGDTYAYYDPRDHQPPSSAPDADSAELEPWSLVYDADLHAQSEFVQVFGHLNINSAPTTFEIEALLRGPFGTSAIMTDGAPETIKGPDYIEPTDSRGIENGLKDAAIPLIARDLMKVRPFYSPSHLARVLGELIDKHDALPPFHNDAQAEETFARVFNTTTFSSRHFRIFTYGEILSDRSESVLSTSARVYEVFLHPIRNSNGDIIRTQLEVLSVREL